MGKFESPCAYQSQRARRSWSWRAGRLPLLAVLAVLLACATIVLTPVPSAHALSLVVNSTGDGFFAAFDGPARAVRAAAAIRDALGELEIAIRAGLHTGECEVADGKVAGIAVSIGARIAALAEPGEVLVSNTVKDLVAGSDLRFEDRGEHDLKGVPEPWRLFALIG